MNRVPSALQTDVTGLGWFKVFEDGYDGTSWGVDRMVANHGVVNFTIPSCIPSGNYFLRAEMSKSSHVLVNSHYVLANAELWNSV